MKNRIKDLRKKKELTQEELARKLSITRQTIHALEKHKADPSLSLAFKISKFFDKAIEDIFEHREERIKVKKCPVCKSHNVTFDLGGQTGKYLCKDCSYLGSLIIEEEIIHH